MKTFVVGDIHGRCAQLHNLLGMLPRDESAYKLVFLGDLIDRGPDVPGCVEHILNLCKANPEQVLCLRGNHEQMLLDFLDDESLIWMTTATGGDQTFRQYTDTALRLRTDADFAAARDLIAEKIPAGQIEFFRQLPLYHELSRQAVRVRSHAHFVSPVTRPSRPSRHLCFPQLDRNRHGIQPALAAHVSVAA